MDRKKLLDDIQVLSSMLARAESHERRAQEADERDAHIELQVTRLEDAALKVERRLIELDAVEPTEPEYPLVEKERAEMAARLETLRDKAERLRREALENEVFDAAAYAARSEGLPARLRAALHALVTDLHDDARTSRADIRPFQARLAELVRDRRGRLHTVAERVGDARDYVTSVVAIIEDVLQAAREMSPLRPGEPWPFAAERALGRTRVEMARVAFKEAHSQLRAVAHDWPELADLASRRDWKRIPFLQLEELIAPRERPARDEAFTEHLAEGREMAQAIALWLEELRQAVAEAPPPGPAAPHAPQDTPPAS